MQAILQHGYGAPERVLRLVEVDRPTPADDQVLVRLRASSVNASDWRAVRADPFIVRLTGGLRRPREPRVGGDAAGIVEAVGTSVTHLAPGDEVYGIRTGAYGEYVAGRTFVRKPANMSFEEAAAVPIAATTALQGLRDHGQLTAGQRVLVTGAGGGVGTYAVQIARALGGRVTAASRAENLDLLRSLGAIEVIDHGRRDALRGAGPFDLIADVGGNWSFPELRRVLAPGGTLVVIGAGRGRFVDPLRRMATAVVRARVLGQRLRPFIAKVRTSDLDDLRALIEAGQVRSVIDRTYPLAEVAAAVRHAETGQVRGKVVITI